MFLISILKNLTSQSIIYNKNTNIYTFIIKLFKNPYNTRKKKKERKKKEKKKTT